MSKETQTAKILKLLKEKGSATNIELNKICFRYGGRLYDLRKDGHDIISIHEKGAVWRFYLKDEA